VSIDETDGMEGRSQPLAQRTLAQIRELAQEWGEDAAQWSELERDRRVGVRKLALQARKRWAAERAERERCERLLQFERRFWGRGMVNVAGVDEVGRGCLAGPVVAAAVILPADFSLLGLDDSKKLSRQKREQLCIGIREQARAVGIGQIEAGEIDRLNILQASLKAMREALGALDMTIDQVLVDGHICPRSPFEEMALVDGDARSLSIAAASIVAKVYRDRLMIDYADEYPEYGFAAHKGYGSAEHLAALHKHGPCPLHRISFGPVSDLVQKRRRSQEPHSPVYDSFAEGFASCATPAELERMAHFVKEGSGDLSAEELRDLRQVYREHKVRVEDVGLQGEQRAAEYLSAAGYQVVERRYSGSGGEVDLIVRREGTYAFVEVKTRAHASSYAPEARVNAQKRRRLVRAARHYLHAKGLEVDCRFDVIAVTLGPGDSQVEHWPNAFDA